MMQRMLNEVWRRTGGATAALATVALVFAVACDDKPAPTTGADVAASEDSRPQPRAPGPSPQGAVPPSQQAAPVNPTGDSKSPVDPRVARAQAALAPLKKSLKATLIQALADGGPAHAVEACKLEAPTLARDASGETVTVGRSALRLRNPKNAAPDWVLTLMRELAQEKEPDSTSRSTPLSEGSFGYVESIVTGAMCLTCHGKTVPAEVEAALAEKYPQDRARGFELGSFRGVFWVELNEG